MRITKSELEAVAVKPAQYPEANRYEIAFAGRSNVGKSSLLNALSPGLCLETGGLSKKTARGRHTTRFSELLPLPGLGATVIDTPGFSILECLETQPEELKEYYPEFAGSVCRFDGCLH